MPPLNEADTCRKFVTPRLIELGWDDAPHQIAEQHVFTDGRIFVHGNNARRGRQKRADYLLRYRPTLPLAVIEAKANFKHASEGLEQAKEYAEILGLKFAYSTNGRGIVEFDYITGVQREVDNFPSPAELWGRFKVAELINEPQVEPLVYPYNTQLFPPRYYQEIAIRRTVQAVVQGQKRILITMATGTGKTDVAAQISWKLWNTRWNPTGAHRKTRILFLADRNILVDDPRTKKFAAFGDACVQITGGKVVTSREIYFSTYQSIAEDERRPGLFREFDPDFFDLIIIDECHRGSANREGNWRTILDYFASATQLGMTATPLREDNRDTYEYFGDPIYTYSLRQGIEDGYLAPYRVYRVITTADAAGWRPSRGEMDRYGRPIPDEQYETKDFERIVALRSRTKAIARHITEHLKRTDRLAKTIVFCVDQEHALEMRDALAELNADMLRKYPNYVCRVTADEGDVGRGHLGNFQDTDKDEPVILTTSQLLTTGVDAPTIRNVALARVVGSMTEFKQIIGRGTRVYKDKAKFFFSILDYTGSATSHFADPAFDGEPNGVTGETIDDEGTTIDETEISPEPTLPEDEAGNMPPDMTDDPTGPRKLYVDGGAVEIMGEIVYELDGDGKKLGVIKYIDYSSRTVRTLYKDMLDLQTRWRDPESRNVVLDELADRGIDFDELRRLLGKRDADAFDLLCHLAFGAPLRTRRERAERLKRDKQDFFDRFGPEARGILTELLEKYAEHGFEQLRFPDILKVPPLSTHGNVSEIAQAFGSPECLREAIEELQREIYAV